MKKQTEKGIVFLNGTPPEKEIYSNLNFADYVIICADGAYNYTKSIVMPDILLGDFDSLDLKNEVLDKSIEVVAYKSEKNFTDGYLAVKELYLRGIKEIIFLGAFGGRIDHEYVNYDLLALCNEYGIKGIIKNKQFDVCFMDAENESRTLITTMPINKIFSVVPFSEVVHILLTSGLYYECRDLILDKTKNLTKDSFVMGISNKTNSKTQSITLKSGKALVFCEK